jgi:uncharacterized protein YbbK (DUF523 family)
MEKEKILVSACMRGLYCRYDGKSKINPDLLLLKERYLMIPVCPELFGGLPIPREPSEILGGSGYDVLEGKAKVIAKDGSDRTSDFIKGAYDTLALAKNAGIKKVVFKSKSPSCGCGKIFDGNFSRNLINGDGVTTALLKQNGIEVYTEDEVDKLLK